MSEPLFPVNLSDIPCEAIFHDAPEDGCDFGCGTVWALPVSHQGPTVGYRIEADWTLAYIPDHEPALGQDLESVEPSWLSGYPLAHGCDVLLHDSQYSEEEYPAHVGWGHTSIDQVVNFAMRSKVAQLVMFHHDPRHSDTALDELLGRARESSGGARVVARPTTRRSPRPRGHEPAPGSRSGGCPHGDRVIGARRSVTAASDRSASS